jgi:hypothetical protein
MDFVFQLEKGVDGLFDSFARLDTRISSVGQTAAKIGDHLQVKLFLYPVIILLCIKFYSYYTLFIMILSECRCSEGNS